MTEAPIDFTSLRQAVASLEEGLDVVNDEAWFKVQAPKVRNMLIAGVIQNFEFVYELSVKMLKRIIEFEAASPDEVDHLSFRDLLRTAAEKGLIDDVTVWFGYRELRNITAHTYDLNKARQVYDKTTGFLADARELLTRLESRHG